jgi:hypothetical protein
MGMNAKGGDNFFVVMTLPADVATKVQIDGQCLDAIK